MDEGDWGPSNNIDNDVNFDDDDLGDWEDEMEKEEQQAAEASQPVVPKPKRKTLEEKKREREEARLKEAERKAEEEALAKKMMTEAGRNKLSADSEMAMMAEQFSGLPITDAAKSIDNFEPSTKDEFDRLQGLIVDKINKYAGSAYYSIFIENLCRSIVYPLDVDTLRRISTACTSVANEKMKQQKATVKTKRSKGKAIKKVRTGVDAVQNDEQDIEDEFDDMF